MKKARAEAEMGGAGPWKAGGPKFRSLAPEEKAGCGRTGEHGHLSAGEVKKGSLGSQPGGMDERSWVSERDPVSKRNVESD